LAALDYVKGPDIPPFIPRYEADYRLPPEVNQKAVETYLEALKMRRKAHEMTALWGGKMPHQQAITPGGVTEIPDAQKVIEFKYRLKDITAFIDNVYIPIVQAVAGAYSDLFDVGRGSMGALAYGAFPLEKGMDHVNKKKFFPSGVYIRGQYKELNPDYITEEVKYSWYEDDTGGNKPVEAVVTPNAEKKDAYSWIKAPRYNGEVVEVGPLARQWILKQKDVVALGEKAFSVMGRHFARAIEASAVAHALDEWVGQVEPGKPVSTPHKIPGSAVGMGLTEAARGALGHWNVIEHQRTAVYNAIVPSTWNMSPRDAKGVMGTMEQALIGTTVKDPKNPVEIVRIVRSYDPCLACAIHIMTPDKKTVSKFAIN